MNNVKETNSHTITSKRKRKRKRVKTNAKMIALFSSAIASLLIVSLLIINTPNVYISVGMIPLVCGLVYEFKQLSQSWTKAFIVMGWTQLASLLCFLPGRSEHEYLLEGHISAWPFFFCILYIIAGIALYHKQLVCKLGEGITMLQSFSFIYWMCDLDMFTSSNYFFITIGFLGIIASLFSLFHGYSYTMLGKTNRFLLSLWSSVIMVIFAIDNIYHVFSYSEISYTDDTGTIVTHMAQYFLLGVSAIHIVRNIFMITGFIPGRDTFFNKQYFKDVKELKELHISRYSDSQINIRHALILSFLTIVLFGVNFYYRFVPRNFLIWALFFTLPFFLVALNPSQQIADNSDPLEDSITPNAASMAGSRSSLAKCNLDAK